MTTPPGPPGGIAGGIADGLAGSVLPIRGAEELIATLPGVISVRIVPGELGVVDEIHVLTTDQVPPKNTVRNIESALIAQLGLRVNHRKISVATTVDAPRASDRSAEPPAPTCRPSLSSAPRAEAAAGRRLLIFEDVEVRRSRSRGVLCRVTLSRDGQAHSGEAEGQDTERSRIEVAARATLQAISSATRSATSLALEGAKLIDAFDRAYVFVSVSARVGREPVCLAGVCEVRDSAETSAVLSVLNATNRWVHLDR